MQELRYVCPKCGEGVCYPENETHYCRFCKTELIETSYTIDERVEQIKKGTVSDFDAKVFNEYVKDNPLYDPDEATRSYMKKQADGQKQTAWLNQSKQEENNNKPHCPNCKSINICKITTGNRIASGAVFGIFSSNIGKTMKCRDCGYKW